jgi:stage V sporulation protein R
MDVVRLKELEKSMNEIEGLATKEGLDYYEMIYEIVPSNVLDITASFGMPNRFSHWTFGRPYQRMKKMNESHLSKVFEIVFNTNPCLALLLDSNTLLENKLIIAHVLGHSDFFKNNVYFSKTNRGMHEEMKKNSLVIESLENEFGEEEVEKVLDDAIMIEEQPEIIEALIQNIEEEWKKELFQIVKKEYSYFKPQMQTKILNEGWATYWHAKLMREIDLSPKETIEYAKMHASVIKPTPNGINPYRLGYKLLLHIEKKHGTEELFRIREEENDYTFIKKYFTEEVAESLDMYVSQKQRKKMIVKSKDFEEIKNEMLLGIVNSGIPKFTAEKKKDSIVCRHHHDGHRSLDLKMMEEVMKRMKRYVPSKEVQFYTNIEKREMKFHIEKKKPYGETEWNVLRTYL